MSNPNRRIKLTLSQQTVFASGETTYNITVTASNANLMGNPTNAADDNIFLMTQNSTQPLYTTPKNTFLAVCAPIDMASLPVSAPDTDSNNKFRTNTITLTFIDPDQATDAWSSILSKVQQLKRALDFTDSQTSASFWVGIPPV